MVQPTELTPLAPQETTGATAGALTRSVQLEAAMARHIALTRSVLQGTTGEIAGALTRSVQPEVAMARAVVQMLLELCAAVSNDGKGVS